MRRIPRPQRAIDPSLAIAPLLQRGIPPTSCLRAALPHPHLRTTSACFSTTPSVNFLLGGKQDKKKHQAFVRRWQKRILGDSEPIGAHVDPYDPSSPVRIAPEEQGEEVEMLEGEEVASGAAGKRSRAEMLVDRVMNRPYKEATEGPLLHVGSKEWIDHADEVKMAQEFEKLTMRTYTPMTQSMADQIEQLTGNLYTLRDENLMMAQTFDEATGKPYTDFSFGRRTRVRKPEALRKNFHQAVVEIYALKQAGKDLDISKQANRGIYNPPKWIKDVKLQQNGAGDFVLAFPNGRSLEALLEEMQRVPDYTPLPEEMDAELLAEEGEPLAPEAAVPPPTMDPATPEFKKAALVKDDEEKPKFDFMSNRPVPRTPKPAAPVAPVAETVEATPEAVVVEEVVEEVVAVPKSAAPKFDFDAALATSASTLSELRQAVLDSASKPTSSTLASQSAAKWQNVPLTDINLKFALSKRLLQLTGNPISDPHLTTSTTLAALYHHVCGTASPTPTSVFTYIHVEGSRQNAKQKAISLREQQYPPTMKNSASGELLKLGNVELRRRKENRIEKRVKIGLQKVVQRELREKKLASGGERGRNWEERKRRREEVRSLVGAVREFGFRDAKRWGRGENVV